MKNSQKFCFECDKFRSIYAIQIVALNKWLDFHIWCEGSGQGRRCTPNSYETTLPAGKENNFR